MEITLIILQHRINISFKISFFPYEKLKFSADINISFIFLTLISHISNYCIKTDNIL